MVPGLGSTPAIGGQGATDIIALLNGAVSSPANAAFIAFAFRSFLCQRVGLSCPRVHVLSSARSREPESRGCRLGVPYDMPDGLALDTPTDRHGFPNRGLHVSRAADGALRAGAWHRGPSITRAGCDRESRHRERIQWPVIRDRRTTCYISVGVTDAELEAERIALVAEQRAVEREHERLRLRPEDLAAHIALLARLNAHAARVRAFKDALQQRSDT
jgi:hypothetical protein